MGFGEFYGDQNRSIYLGQALIDAYNYAETQDWIGFIITPSTVKELDDSKNVPSRVNYFEHDVIFKQNNIKRLYAYKPQSGMRDPMLQSRTDSGVLIRDLIFYNNRSLDFLKDIYDDYGCRQIVMELKNVREVNREHIFQLNRYLNDQFGNFGIV